jgi:U3 small nucleolar RNA-associated protein 13
VAIGKGHTEAVAAVAFSKKVASMFVVSGSKDRTLKMWNLNDLSASDNNEIPSLTAVQTVLAHDKDINAVCVAPNDKMIATASADKTIKLWNAAGMSYMLFWLYGVDLFDLLSSVF